MAKWGRKKIRSGNCCFYAQDIGWNLLLESVDIYYLLGLFQATSKTPAIKRFTIADEKDMQRDMENQRNWNGLVENVQEIV